MRRASGQWDDLLARVGTGAALASLGLFAMWAGGIWFHLLIAAASAIMVWELGRMLGGGSNIRTLASACFLAVMVAGELPPSFALPLLMAPGIVAASQVPGSRPIYAIYTVAILLAGYGLMVLRDDFGFRWMAWLALVVIATDVLGYFAGRLIGGPKFWPQISPKKTWAGTVAGWIGAVAVGAVFMATTGIGAGILGASLALSMASQLGDIAESAVKRRSGVKDSSSILPGHGGLFDRFDGMLGASLLFLLMAGIADLPLGAG
jgi:phosphatidate cytidylyltransferase